MFPFNPAALCGIMIAQSAIQTDIIGLSGFTGIIPASHGLESKWRLRLRFLSFARGIMIAQSASQTSITVCAPHPKNKQKGITFYVGL